jgi:hypothetical protein
MILYKISKFKDSRSLLPEPLQLIKPIEHGQLTISKYNKRHAINYDNI